MVAPSIVDNADYGRIIVLSVLDYDGVQVVTFQDDQGLTTLGFFDENDKAIARPVRFRKNSSGLFEFDFPGADPLRFVVGPSLNVTPC